VKITGHREGKQRCDDRHDDDELDERESA